MAENESRKTLIQYQVIHGAANSLKTRITIVAAGFRLMKTPTNNHALHTSAHNSARPRPQLRTKANFISTTMAREEHREVIHGTHMRRGVTETSIGLYFHLREPLASEMKKQSD